MKNVIAASVMSLTLGLVSLMAQEKKDMPMKEGMPMKGEGMQGGGMMMRKGMGCMMKGESMMKSEDTKAWER